MQHPHRTVLVPRERLSGWVERFGTRHGEVSTDRSRETVVLAAVDGAVAEFDESPPPARFGLVLVRRGGFAVGLVEGTALSASKCGTRYVQGKTKAGGWSQQRYARRRANQAAGVAEAAGSAVAKVLGPDADLVVYGGGDRRLVDAAVDASHVRCRFAERWLDVPEPRYAVLEKAVEQARSVPIALNELA